MKELPDRLSDLIALAHADLREAEESPDYRIDMLKWHTPRGRGGRRICEVCFAGAVMAFSLDTPRIMETSPGRFGNGVRHKLEALDAARVGAIGQALRLLELGDDARGDDGPEDGSRPHELNREMPHYGDGANAFHMALDQLEIDLRGAGL